MRMRAAIQVGFAGVFGVMSMLALCRKTEAQTVAARAACGNWDVHFSVKEDRSHPAMEPVPAGKAMVVFAVDAPGGAFDTFTTRIGVDGTWMGATRAGQYISFPVEPGAHHLCAGFQGAALANLDNPVALHSLRAEAGKTYYFRVRVYRFGDGIGITSLEAMDEDEGTMIVESTPRSVFKINK